MMAYLGKFQGGWPVLPNRLARVALVCGGLVCGLAAGLLPGLAVTPAQAETRAGYALIEVSNGRVVAAREVREGFIPASVAKLPAAITILHRLGPDYRFSTTLAYTGGLERDGTLKGDLLLVGGGDPSLEHGDLQEMAQALQKAGIKRIRGRFLYDASALPSQPVIEARQPADVSYNPPLSGLALDYNRFRLQWPAGGKAPQGSRDFPLTPLPVDVPATPLPGNDGWLPVRDPGLFAAQTLAFYAARGGLSLPSPQPSPQAVSVETSGATLLVTHQSDRLADILRRTLQFSNNVAMEMMALKATGASGTVVSGERISKTVAELIPNVAWGSLVLPNASGLTDQARMSPGQCASLAAQAATMVVQGQALRDLLPVKMLDLADDEEGASVKMAPQAKATVRAKSGTIFYGRALAGVLTAASGRDYAFCIMRDDMEQRAVYDRVPFDQRQADPVRLPAKAWLKEAREDELALLRDWISRM